MKHILMAIMIFPFIAACQTKDGATPIFVVGQIVKMRAFEKIGTVVYTNCIMRNQCTYTIRISAMQATTNTSLFADDKPIDFSPMSLIEVKEFELIEVPDTTN